MRRPAVVAEYDPVKHMARARLTTAAGTGGMTPWCHVQEAAGAQNSRTTLTVGQTVWVDCPNGDLRQAQISLGTFSDTHKSSSQAAEETRLERGQGWVAVRPEQVELRRADGIVSINGDESRMAHGDGVVRIQDGSVYINC